MGNAAAVVAQTSRTGGKWILKKALEPIVPREILYRTKQGLATPLAELFRREAIVVRQRLVGPAMADCGLFDLAAVERIIAEHQTENSTIRVRSGLLLTFEGFLVMADTHAEAASKKVMENC